MLLFSRRLTQHHTLARKSLWLLAIALLQCGPSSHAQTTPLSPVAPEYKWGQALYNNPNVTHVFDSYSQANAFFANEMMAEEKAYYTRVGASADITLKRTPRDDIPRSQLGSHYPYSYYCCGCSSYSFQNGNTIGLTAIEAHQPPPGIIDGCEYRTRAKLIGSAPLLSQ